MVSRLKNCLAIFLCNPFWGCVSDLIFGEYIPVYGFRIYADTSLVAIQTRARLFWNLYERGEIRLTRRFLRRDLDTVELGASIGVMTCQLRQLLKNKARLIAVEANPDLIPVIKKNLETNHLYFNTELLNYAVDYSGPSVLLSIGRVNTGSRVLRPSDASDNILPVPAVTLSKIIAQYRLDEYVLVADIEGSEMDIILQDGAALDKCQQVIIELHNKNGYEMNASEALERLIHQHGFVLVAQHGPVCVLAKSK